MGFHYARADRVDGEIEPSEPELLLYEPQTDGGMRLIGVEFLVLADVWDASNDDPPKLAGQPFDDHRAEELRHGLPFAHYELHVWAWVGNESGVLAPFQPGRGMSGRLSGVMRLQCRWPIFRNRVRMEAPDTLVIVSEGERTSGQGGVVQIGVTTARRRL